MDQKQVINAVTEFKKASASKFNPKEVYLFGSYAKGNTRKDSDIDVAFVYDDYKGDTLEGMTELFKIAYDIDYRIEPIIVDNKSDITGFLTEIKETGILI
jgi:predicted nucleotidyltransferase